MSFDIRVDSFPDSAALDALWLAAWGAPIDPAHEQVLQRSLVHLCAFQEARLIGYVNVAWDGGQHAFLLDPTVHPDHRRKGLGSALVAQAIALSRERGAQWLHVDFEPALGEFYQQCGFNPTEAGIIKLKARQ